MRPCACLAEPHSFNYPSEFTWPQFSLMSHNGGELPALLSMPLRPPHLLLQRIHHNPTAPEMAPIVLNAILASCPGLLLS